MLETKAGPIKRSEVEECVGGALIDSTGWRGIPSTKGAAKEEGGAVGARIDLSRDAQLDGGTLFRREGVKGGIGWAHAAAGVTHLQVYEGPHLSSCVL